MKTVKSGIGVHMRWFKVESQGGYSDKPQALDIERRSLAAVGRKYKPKWSVERFCHVVTEKLFKSGRPSEYLGMAAEYDGKIIGYMFYKVRNKTIHLLNFVVDPPYCGKGVDTQMIAKLTGVLAPHRCTRIVTWVRERDLEFQRLLYKQKPKFRWIATYPDFYEDEVLGGDAKQAAWVLECQLSG